MSLIEQLTRNRGKLEFEKSTSYDILTRNCSDIVLEALMNGGAKQFAPAISIKGITTPAGVDKIATQLMIAISHKTASYQAAIDKIVVDKAPTALPNTAEWSKTASTLIQDGVAKKAAEAIQKALVGFGATKDLDARIDALAALLIAIGAELPKRASRSSIEPRSCRRSPTRRSTPSPSCLRNASRLRRKPSATHTAS